ncbi:PilZ domain-containing protein [Sphingomonas sp. LB-2]|uniref:PilZ domain-containing protein n=1 Tax=Sphingomonas caeni TaxID=2984949 RepID=UPI00222F4F01|nr:PilZ domain-containing protein [Sphingomonas caeni]MCW3847622.1 PilZ domain-containing protein [Sphingomonas caeni]
MSLGMGNLAFADGRREGREDVHYRAKAFGADARQLNIVIVNISPHGMMARCEREFEIDDRIQVTLPVVGVVAADVRWSLGGRIGCQFDPAINLAGYYELIAAMMKAK